MRRSWLACLLALIAFVLPMPLPAAQVAVPGFIASAVPKAQLVGHGRMTYITMDVYDAELYAPGGKYAPERPFALSLTYLLNMDGTKIADHAIEEMREQGFSDEIVLAAWHDKLVAILPDVRDGTMLTGIMTRRGATLFYRNGLPIGSVGDPEFGKRFFAIWLGPGTSQPELKAKLLNHTGSKG